MPSRQRGHGARGELRGQRLIATAGLGKLTQAFPGLGQAERRPFADHASRTRGQDRQVGVGGTTDQFSGPIGFAGHFGEQQIGALGDRPIGEHEFGPERRPALRVTADHVPKDLFITTGQRCKAAVPALGTASLPLPGDHLPRDDTDKPGDGHYQAGRQMRLVSLQHGLEPLGQIVFRQFVPFFSLHAMLHGNRTEPPHPTGLHVRANRGCGPSSVKTTTDSLPASVCYISDMPAPATPQTRSMSSRPSRSVASGLNEAQTQAVTAPVGPLLVLAGAGTGKTRVVIARILHLVRRGTPPPRILAVTFTNKAAKEMLSRIGNRFGPGPGRDNPDAPDAHRPEVSTIHSLCVRILRRHARLAGYPDRFSIIDRGEQESMARKVLKELKVAEARLRPGDLLDRVSRWKSRGLRPDAALDSLSAEADESWTLAAAGSRRYQQALKSAAAVDFDDLLLVVDELFDTHEEVRRQEAGRFDHVLVDEYQDTSGIQERILSALARDHRSFCVVGDDDQSIYAWRGAQISHILEFPSRWPGATVVRLEENYRSTPEIIRAANLLIACNSRRHGKQLVSRAASGLPPSVLQAQDEEDEARRVVGDVESLLRERMTTPDETVILVRTGEQTRVFEQELRRRDIPYELIGSRSFFDRREIKDVMAFLRVLVDPDDDLALSRIVNVPPRGLAQAALTRARQTASEEGVSLWQALRTARGAGHLSAAAAGGVATLERLLAWGRRAGSDTTAAEAIRTLLVEAGYERHLRKDYEDQAEQDARWASVEELVNSLARYESRHRGQEPARLIRRFLDDLILEVEEAERFKDDKPKGNVLRLMTLHAAKGLEFDCVWMVGMEEGLLPHVRAVNEGLVAIDEERRLGYVGVTRARKRLVLSLALTRMKWGKAKPCKPSRFLYELTGQAEKFVDGPAEEREKIPSRGRGRR